MEHSLPHFWFGLWIVWWNVEALGGTATAKNVPEAGLKITLRVPLAE